jgi:exonuclease III
MFRGIIILCLLMVIFSCAKNKVIDSSGPSINIGTDSNLDIITWNIQNFPKHNTTLNYLLELISIMDPDIIALQEIENETAFNTLKDRLDSYNGIITNSASYNINLALLYSNNLEVESIYEIFEDDWWSFPRPPLVAQIVWNGQNVYIINNHFKAMGGTENKDRRKSASEKLENYVNEYWGDENIIILGDLNDDLNDEDVNVFQNFINDSTNYKFVDMDIANGSSGNWSYPDWPSHLDHILITNELFDEFDNTGSTVQTIHIEDYFNGGWSDYKKYISDHRPVILSLNFYP